MPEADKSQVLKPWEMEHSKKSEPPKSWEMLVDMEEQEQQKRKQESLKLLESTRQQERKPELSVPWEGPLKEDDCKRELPKSWVTRTAVTQQQDSPKLWLTKAKDDRERKQDVPKPWMSKAKGELDQKQELPKTWIAQTREEKVQKQESVKPWGACVREEMEQKKQEPTKPWVAHVRREVEEQKIPETPEGSQKILPPPSQNPPNVWATANLTPKEQPISKASDVEPKEVSWYSNSNVLQKISRCW